MGLVRACGGLFPPPVKEKAVLWTWCALAMGFSPACRGKSSHGHVSPRQQTSLQFVVKSVCKPRMPTGHFPWEQCVPTCPPDSRHHHNLWSSRSASQECPLAWRAVMGFPPCLSRKRLSRGACDGLLPPACRGKGTCVITSTKPNRTVRRPIKDKHKRISPYVRRLFYLYKRRVNLCARMVRSPHTPQPSLS